jgi:hypothetical protein
MASTALATPALARDKSWYIEGDGGLMVEYVCHIDGVSGAGKLETKTGFDFGIVGYDFGMFHLETG